MSVIAAPTFEQAIPYGPPPEATFFAGRLETRFGIIQLDPGRLLSFSAGMPGFPGYHRFQLERLDRSPLLLLQSLDDGDVGFFVMPLAAASGLVRAADRLSTCRLLSLHPDHADFLAIVTVRRGVDGVELYANLRAPLLIDTVNRTGAQIVLPDPSYPLRHRVLPSSN